MKYCQVYVYLGSHFSNTKLHYKRLLLVSNRYRGVNVTFITVVQNANYCFSDVLSMIPISFVQYRNICWLCIGLTTSVLLAGCTSSMKKDTSYAPSAARSVLTSPSLAYLTNEKDSEKVTAAQWQFMAKKYYQSKSYARALRAANQALGKNNQLVTAREIAMMSALKLSKNNVSVYHNNEVMAEPEKAKIKETLNDVITLVNTEKKL